MLNTLQRCRLSQTLLNQIFLPVTGIQLSGSLSVLHLLNLDFKAIELTVYSAMSRTLWDKWALVSGSLPVCKWLPGIKLAHWELRFPFWVTRVPFSKLSLGWAQWYTRALNKLIADPMVPNLVSGPNWKQEFGQFACKYWVDGVWNSLNISELLCQWAVFLHLPINSLGYPALPGTEQRQLFCLSQLLGKLFFSC